MFCHYIIINVPQRETIRMEARARSQPDVSSSPVLEQDLPCSYKSSVAFQDWDRDMLWHHSCLMAHLPSNCLVSQTPKYVGRDNWHWNPKKSSPIRTPSPARPLLWKQSSAQPEKASRGALAPLPPPTPLPQGLAVNLHKLKEQICQWSTEQALNTSAASTRRKEMAVRVDASQESWLQNGFL